MGFSPGHGGLELLSLMLGVMLEFFNIQVQTRKPDMFGESI